VVDQDLVELGGVAVHDPREASGLRVGAHLRADGVVGLLHRQLLAHHGHVVHGDRPDLGCRLAINPLFDPTEGRHGGTQVGPGPRGREARFAGGRGPPRGVEGGHVAREPHRWMMVVGTWWWGSR
jgi:hypothetical protein